MFIPHTLKFPWKSLYVKKLLTVFESKHFNPFMLNEMYTKGFGILQKLIKCAFSQHVVRRLSCNYDMVISDQLYFTQKNHHLCASKAVFALKEKNTQKPREHMSF